MKKLLFALLICQYASSQISMGEVKHKQINIILDPYASYKEKGINIGGEFEYVSDAIYLKAGTTLFPGLEPIYIDAYVGGGVNFKYGHFDKFRMFTGIKVGYIYRESAPTLYPIFGIEAGMSHELSESVSIGAKMSYDNRQDAKFWDDQLNSYWRYSGFVFVTLKL